MSVFHIGMLAGGVIGLLLGIVVTACMSINAIESAREAWLEEARRQ